MSGTIAQVRQALSDAVDSISGLRAVPYMPDNLNPPQAVVWDTGVDYDLVLGRGADEWNFTVNVYVSRTAELAGQKLLDTLREPSGATSLKTVVEADSGLAALVDYARVRSASPIVIATVNDTPYLSVEFTVEIVY